MRCRRCLSTRLLRLAKRLAADNDVFRCRDCGYLFSPAAKAGTAPPGRRPDPGPPGGPPSGRRDRG